MKKLVLPIIIWLFINILCGFSMPQDLNNDTAEAIVALLLIIILFICLLYLILEIGRGKRK